MRIVSLIPSGTEIVASLGLAESLVGRTHECDYPPSVATTPVVTSSDISQSASSADIDRAVRESLKDDAGLYHVDVDAVVDLEPDLIITQTLCDVCAVSPTALQAAMDRFASKPTWIDLTPTTLEEVFDSILLVAAGVDRVHVGEVVIEQLRARVEAVEDRASRLKYRPLGMLLEWTDPPFAAGHWNPELMKFAGCQNAFGTRGERSEQIAWQDIARVDPEFIYVACCGFDADRGKHEVDDLEQHPVWNSLAAVKTNNVFVGDGSAHFNRPGPRLLDGLEHLVGCVESL
ncbi:MAG: cobalamin-binding protein [Planctomycetota bacterium]